MTDGPTHSASKDKDDDRLIRYTETSWSSAQYKIAVKNLKLLYPTVHFLYAMIFKVAVKRLQGSHLRSIALKFFKHGVFLHTEFRGNLPELTRRRHGPMSLQSKEECFILCALL